MPGADGYELVRWIRQQPAEKGGLTPAVAVTAHARREAREQALNAGFQHHTAKPVDVNDLIATIAKLGGAGSKLARKGGSG
jgi:CheY-like chemotaxis protein